MKRIIKMINNERLNVKRHPQKACDSGSYDFCTNIDNASCVINSYDYCQKDLAPCVSNSYDKCTIDICTNDTCTRDYSGCLPNNEDIRL